MKLLLQHCNLEESGMNVKDICALGATPFMLACYCGQKDIVKLLLGYTDEQISFNAKDNLGLTGFMLACQNGKPDVVQVLLEDPGRNIDFNVRDKSGLTAPSLAYQHGHKDVVKILRDNWKGNFDLNARDDDDDGSTAPMMTCLYTIGFNPFMG